MITGTEQQENIWNDMQNGDGHIVVYAGAGVGKTFTIVEGANRMSGKKAFFAFNKSIATELGERLPDDVVCSTMHSFGFKAIRSAGRTKMDKSKTFKIIQEVCGSDYFAVPLAKLVSLMKGALVEGNDRQQIARIIDKFNINFESDMDEVIAYDSLPRIMRMSRNYTTIDFDDMIWIPIVENLPVEKFDVVFVDEAQDLNEMQRQLIYRCVEPNGRCVVVGDPNQAIYGFRGADSSSMDMFVDLLKMTSRDINKFPLTLTWRCPKNVVAEANRYVSNFSCREDAEDGFVKEFAEFNPVKDDIVLCRYNAPLAQAFYTLLSEGKSAYVLGRDMHKGLTNLVKKVARKKLDMDTGEFRVLLIQYGQKETAKLVKKDKKNQALALADKLDCIHIFNDRVDTVRQIISEIERVFSSEGKGDIMLSTVHKAKGLEADNVFLLATERMPHPKASNPQEERNICYVAITRAKKNLYYCGPRPQ